MTHGYLKRREDIELMDDEYAVNTSLVQWTLRTSIGCGTSHPSLYFSFLGVDAARLCSLPKLLLILKVLDAGFVAFGPADRDEYLQFGSERKRFDGRLSRPKSYFVALIKAEELFDAMPVRAGRFPYILHQGTDAYYKCLLRAATIEEFCRIMDIVEADLDYADQQKKLAELDLLNSCLDPTPVEVSDIEHKKFLAKMSREIIPMKFATPR